MRQHNHRTDGREDVSRIPAGAHGARGKRGPEKRPLHSRTYRARGFQAPADNVNVGYSREISIAMGLGGNRGHATFFAAYRDVDAVLQRDFDFGACTLNSRRTNPDAMFQSGDLAGEF